MSALLRPSSEISGLSGSSRRFVLMGFALVGGVVIAATTFAVLETRGLEQKARDTIDDTLNSIRVLGRLENQVEKRQTLLHQHVLATESVERAIVEAQLAAVEGEIATSISAFDRWATGPGERAAWNQTRSELAALEATIGRGLTLSRQDRIREARQVVHGLGLPLARINGQFEKLVYMNEMSASVNLSRLATIRRRLLRELLGLAVATLAGTSLVGWWASRRVARREEETELETRRLEERNRNLDAFAGHVAHDLRNALAAINYAAAHLAAQVPEGDEAIDVLRRGGREMEEIVGDLLALARADIALKGPCDPAEVAAEIEEELGPAIRQAGGTLHVAVDLAPVWCSPGLLRRALANLTENALKYRHPDRPPEIEILGGPAEGGAGYALWVRDNGVGIAPEDVNRIFEPFYRAESTAGVSGTGLGLAIVKRIVEASRGSLWLETTPGRGSTFEVYLPLADAESDSGRVRTIPPIGVAATGEPAARTARRTG